MLFCEIFRYTSEIVQYRGMVTIEHCADSADDLLLTDLKVISATGNPFIGSDDNFTHCCFNLCKKTRIKFSNFK